MSRPAEEKAAVAALVKAHRALQQAHKACAAAGMGSLVLPPLEDASEAVLGVLESCFEGWP